MNRLHDAAASQNPLFPKNLSSPTSHGHQTQSEPSFLHASTLWGPYAGSSTANGQEFVGRDAADESWGAGGPLGWDDRGSQLGARALFAPVHYEPGYAYPLLIWLHSDGGDERELRQVMPHISLRNHVGVAVRAGHAGGDRSTPFGGEAAGGSRTAISGGYVWRQQVDDVADAIQQVRLCIAEARRRFHVHERRIFLAGYEAGGTMALRIGLAHPEWFAGAASIEGPMPRGANPLGRIKTARQLPLLLSTCRQSETYGSMRVADDLRLLHAAGFRLALRQYPGEHDLTTEMLADLDRWMMEQFCCSATVS